MKKVTMILLMLGLVAKLFAQKTSGKNSSGNPIFPGWYADPEAAVFGKQYWVYPTFSAPY